MIQKQHVWLIKFLFSMSFFLSMLGFLISSYGIKNGFYSTILIWSFYILCIPASHGKNIIGYPCWLIFKKIPSTEPYLWTAMVIFNIISFIFYPRIYELTFPTQFLYVILMNPMPCWFAFLASFPGTFYRSLIGVKNYKSRHSVIRSILIIFGIAAFIFFTHRELITLLHAATNQIG